MTTRPHIAAPGRRLGPMQTVLAEILNERERRLPMPKYGVRMSRHTDADLTLKLRDQEAMALEEQLTDGNLTTRVQVTATFVDDNGVEWTAERIIKMRLKRDPAGDARREGGGAGRATGATR